MYNMIDGVLNYSKINSPRQFIEEIDLDQLLDEIITDLELLIQAKEAQFSSTGLPVVMGYRVLLYQLFYNIILNALKFAKTGEPVQVNIQCTISEQQQEKFYRIDITDNGIGFEDEYAGSIFETFTRLNAADEYEGTGLGLALCRKITDRHNGFIFATGELNKGATFTVLLPVSGGAGES